MKKLSELTMTTTETIRLDRVIAAADSVQPLPSTVLRLIEVMGQDDWEIDDIARIVALDQALTAQVLRAVNSAAQSGHAPIADVADAIMRLGPASVLTFSLSRALRPERASSEDLLWRRSVAAAPSVELAKSFGVNLKTIPVETYATALLHDFGSLVMRSVPGAEAILEEIDALARGSREHLEAERRSFGINHAELGCLMAKRWLLPENMIAGIAYHHHPDEHANPVVDMVHLAAEVAALVVGDGVIRSFEGLAPGVVERLSLTESKFEQLSIAVAEQLDETLLRFGN